MAPQHSLTQGGSSSIPKHSSRALKDYWKRRGVPTSHQNPATLPQPSHKGKDQNRPKVPTDTITNQSIASQKPRQCAQIESSTREEVKQDSINFLLLPGEIRNSIYLLVFRHQEYRIKKLKADRGLTHSSWNGKIWEPANVCSETKRHDLDSARRLPSNPSPNCHLTRGTAALLLTCRQINQETCPLFYASNSFSFSSFVVLETFLSSISIVAKSAIKSLVLGHGTYGDPSETKFLRWKIIHDERWAAVCWQAANELINLENLQVRLQINDIPLQLNLEASWAAPLLAFRGRNLKEAHITLLLHGGYGLGDGRLQNCARVVRRELLGSNYREVVKREKFKDSTRKSEGNVKPKAIRCLVIRGF